MGNRRSRVSPSAIAMRSGNKQYFSDGRVLVGGTVMTYSDGSYLRGRFEEGEANGYCVYRDIAGRLIYTGYMEHTAYQGWGAIWNETGEWPEHITFWCASYPGNRVLRVTSSAGDHCQWVSYTNEEPSVMGDPVQMSSECRVLFRNMKDTVINGIEIDESCFSKLISLYTSARVSADYSTAIPPSPHHGPRSRPNIVPRLQLVPDTTTESIHVRNPLTMFRVPPRIR